MEHINSMWVRACVCAQLCLTVAYEAPLSVKFLQQEYWSGLPFPLLGHLPDPWIEPASPVSLALEARFFTAEVFVNVFESMTKASPPFFNLNDFKPIER